MPQANIVTRHRFPAGKYEREITIPPWTVLTGAEHKTDYKVRIEKGTIAVNSDHGIVTLTAPCSFEASAGMQRIGRVFEDEVVWVDIYDNSDNCQDLKTLEDRLYIVPEDGLGENRILARIDEDRKDYLKFVDQFGIPQAQLEAIVTNHDDLIEMPPGFDVIVKPSRLHGSGLFALRNFKKDEFICPGRIEGHRTPAGRFINHSLYPNTTSIKSGDDIGAVALKDIFKDEEILISYRTSVKVNFKIELEEPSCLDG